VLLIAEPGMGKTATLVELGRRASEAGADRWFGRCIEDEGAPAFWPWTQVMRACQASRGEAELRELMNTSAADMAEAMPVIRQWIADLPEAPMIEQTSARFRFFDAVTQFLRRAAEKKPVVLLFDDLQRADQPTLRLLSFVARQVDAGRLMIAASFRPVAAQSSSVREQLTAFIQEVPATCVELDGLDRGDVGAFVELRTGRQPPADLITRLHDLTAGNPLFLEHILHGCETTGQTDSAVDWRRLLNRPEAPGLTGAIARVLGDLDAASRGVLGTAAVLGTEFTVSRLTPLTDQDASGVLSLLAMAKATGILREAAVDPGSYYFTHVLIRDALYSALPLHERARVHGRAAAVLEASGIVTEEMLSELAHHFYQAWPAYDDGKALEYTVRAAETAEKRLAYEEAAVLFERALRILAASPRPEPAYRVRLLLKKGEALSHAAEAEKARVDFLAAVQLARQLGAYDVFATAVTMIAQLPELGDVDTERVSLLQEALAMLAEHDSRRPYLSALLAKSLTWGPHAIQRRELALQAAADARQLRDPLLQANTLHQCGLALAEPAHLATRESIAKDLLRLGQVHGDHRTLWHAATAHVQNALERGDFAGVDRAIGTIEALAGDAREPLYRWYLALFRAMRRYVSGDLRTAEGFALQALHLGACVGESAARAAYCMQVVGWLRIMNRSAECEVLMREMTHRYPAWTAWRLQLAFAECDQGRPELAKQSLTEVMDDPQLIHHPYRLALLCSVAELCCFYGTQEMARALYAEIEPYSDLWGNSGFGVNTFGPVHRFLGMLAVRMRDLDAAEFHLDRALASSDKAGSATFTSLTCVIYAKAALKRGGTRSAQRAGELLSRAETLNVRHGLDGLSIAVRALAGRSGISLSLR
jgi:hypothetical protein